jgi:transcriptional regulator with XRE-family HTH domain
MRKRSKGRKRPPTEVARRINALLARYKDQKEFAEILGLSQTTISTWILGKAKPSPESWLKLGNVAPEDEAQWFWEKGKDALDKLVLSAERYLVERRRPAREDELVRVRRLRTGTEGADAKTGEMLIPAECVPNPGSTFYIVLEGGTCGDALQKGDIVVLDRSESERDPKSLMPFWDQLIVVEFVRPPGTLPPDLRDWHIGFHVGRPYLQGIDQDDGFSWTAEFFPASGRSAARRLLLGYYEERLPVEKMDDRVSADQWRLEVADQSGERAADKIRLPDGLQVLGRVVDVRPGKMQAYPGRAELIKRIGERLRRGLATD